MTLIYKGNELSREFQAAIKYRLVNAKTSYVSSYANFNGASKTIADSIPFKGSNFIGFAISAAFDVNAFFELEDPEKNWGELLGALGVTFVKVWAAGFVGTMFAIIAAILGAPAWAVITLSFATTIAVGYGLDKLDQNFEVKESAKKLGREMIALYDDYIEEKDEKAREEAEKRALDAQMMSEWSKNKHLLFK